MKPAARRYKHNPLTLYEVHFDVEQPPSALVIARTAEEAEDLAEQPDSFDLEWSATAVALDLKQAAKMKKRAEEVVGTHPVTYEDVTLAQWLESGATLAALADAQDEFDALPKLWPDVNPKLTEDALETMREGMEQVE